jgi:hypothetical protein
MRRNLVGLVVVVAIASIGIGAFVVLSRKTTAPMPPGAHLITIAMQDLPGLSGLARDDTGALFAVPEEDRFLLELSASGTEQHRYPVTGVAEGLEFEGLAWLGKDRFAIGTEGGCKDGADHVLLVAREGNGAKVTRDIALPLTAWGASCDEKKGIEGLCAASGKMVAALEKPFLEKNGERFAALARIDETTGEVTAYRMALTSKTGKLAGLDCRLKDGAIDVLAIERHFDVAQLVSFTVPLTGATDETPRPAHVVLDLRPYANGGTRNFEGVVWLDDRHAMLIVDNKYGKVTGPNEMVEVDLPGQ